MLLWCWIKVDDAVWNVIPMVLVPFGAGWIGVDCQTAKHNAIVYPGNGRRDFDLSMNMFIHWIFVFSKALVPFMWLSPSLFSAPSAVCGVWEASTTWTWKIGCSYAIDMSMITICWCKGSPYVNPDLGWICLSYLVRASSKLKLIPDRTLHGTNWADDNFTLQAWK